MLYPHAGCTFVAHSVNQLLVGIGGEYQTLISKQHQQQQHGPSIIRRGQFFEIHVLHLFRILPCSTSEAVVSHHIRYSSWAWSCMLSFFCNPYFHLHSCHYPCSSHTFYQQNNRMALTSEDLSTVYSLLQSALRQDDAIRKPAEATLAACENRPGFCSCLLEIIASRDLEHQSDARWLASVYFKNSINRYWRIRRDSLWATWSFCLFFQFFSGLVSFRAECRFGADFLCSKLLPKFSAATCWCACFVTGWFLSEVCECYLCVSLNVSPHHLFSCPRLKFSILCSLPTCGSPLPACHHMDAYFESSHTPIYFLIFDWVVAVFSTENYFMISMH